MMQFQEIVQTEGWSIERIEKPNYVGPFQLKPDIQGETKKRTFFNVGLAKKNFQIYFHYMNFDLLHMFRPKGLVMDLKHGFSWRAEFPSFSLSFFWCFMKFT